MLELMPVLPRSVYSPEFEGVKNQDAHQSRRIHQAYKPLNAKSPYRSRGSINLVKPT
ncbi:hypothetical protein M2263_002322 [Providencia alcalifaciens]|nr:hypothetical protein [Providencia alcalifaciens]